MRIAMWSGPRNLSTAMMYAFGARGDCAVVDEPFYAAYLSLTGIAHPMRDQILTSQPNDPARAVAQIAGSIPGDFPHFYQKHMAQHMVDGVSRDWMRGVKNVFLIRHPAQVVASYAKKREAPSLDDLGFRQQAELFYECRAAGETPLVVDSADIRSDPADLLKKLCVALGLDYRPSMLTWPAGGHPDDGVWASHWYGAVHRSTGFSGAENPSPELTGDYATLARQALPYYTELHDRRLR